MPQAALKCDECGQEANTIHVLPYVTAPEKVTFACAEHDPGGYWFRIERWDAPKNSMRDHILETKGNGPVVVRLIEERLASTA